MSNLKLVVSNGIRLEHTEYVCTTMHEYPGNCMFCEGGLFACTVCDSFEGATTTHCVGRKMSSVEVDLVYKGLLDFVNGEWEPRSSGSCSSHYKISNGVVLLNGKVIQ